MNGCRVGISLAAQPRVASALLGDELAKDQGFVGRFLITMPDSRIGLREIRGTDPLSDPRLAEFHNLCRRCLNAGLPLREGSRNQLEPPILPLAPEAAALWRRFAQSVEDGCAAGGPWVPVRSAALKMAENVARIAAILTVFQAPEIARPNRITGADRTLEGSVTAETMAAAIAVGTFYLQEALRLTGHAILDPETRAQNDLAEWLAEKHKPGDLVAPSILQKMAPSHLRTSAATLRQRVEALVGFGRLEPAGRQEIDGKAYRETFRVIAPGEAWGPFARDLDDAERRARLRSLRQTARLLAGPRAADLCRLLARAETDLASLEPASHALNAMAATDKRAIWASYAALARSAA